MKAKEFIDFINNGKFYSLEELNKIKNIPEIFEKNLELKDYVDFVTSINIYKCDDGYVEVFGLNSEFSDYNPKQCNILCKASEYKNILLNNFNFNYTGEIWISQIL